METAHRLKLVESVCTLITICSYTVPSSLLPQKVRNMVCRFNLIKRPWNWRNRESRTVPFIQVLGLFTKFCVSNHRRRIYSDWQAQLIPLECPRRKRENCTKGIIKGGPGVRERKIPSFIDLLPDTTLELSGQPQSDLPSSSSFTTRNACQASFILSYQSKCIQTMYSNISRLTWNCSE